MSNALLYSVLDLAPILDNGTAAQAFRNTLDLARHAESFGYTRYWLAEHHNITGIASAATAVVIGHVAAGTKRIRVGSGGIMLPNHAPLVIAEQFGTLESLYPGRIDLGIGRAPGGDGRTARALRKHIGASAETFPQDLLELQDYLGPAQAGQAVRAIPGEGSNVPIYLLGSSDFSAQLAAGLGLPFAFASHFAPDYLTAALKLYRMKFQPSEAHAHPHVMVGVNICLADTDAEAQRLFTSVRQAFLNLIRGTPGQLPPPVETMEGRWNAAERAQVDRMTAVSLVGSPVTAGRKLTALINVTNADEFICTAQLYDHPARVRSFALMAEVFRQVNHARRSEGSTEAAAIVSR